MKILFDGFLYSLQGSGGINRYFSEVIPRLPPSVRPAVFGHQPSPLCPVDRPGMLKAPPAAVARFFKPIFLQWCRRFDLIHPTYYHLESPLSWKSVPGKIVLTVHDFVFAKYGHLYQKSARLLEDQAAAIRRADWIICVSSSTRNDLLERFPMVEKRCCVIPLGASLPKPEKPFRNCEGAPYLLYVGSRVFYKNFILAVKTVVQLDRLGCPVGLVIAGPALSRVELESVEMLGASKFVRVISNPSDAALSELYSGATALIYPSLYEGFGLPPLEAMTLGTPVLALKTSSLPEVVGEGGILIDPQEGTPEAFADAAFRMIQKADLRQKLSQAAHAQAAKFDWEKTATETFAAYERAVQM